MFSDCAVDVYDLLEVFFIISIINENYVYTNHFLVEGVNYTVPQACSWWAIMYQ